MSPDLLIARPDLQNLLIKYIRHLHVSRKIDDLRRAQAQSKQQATVAAVAFGKNCIDLYFTVPFACIYFYPQNIDNALVWVTY